MEVDDEVALGILDVPKGILNLGDATVWGGEEVVAHRLGGLFLAENAAVLKANRRPALDRKTAVFGVLVVPANKVGEGSFDVVSELRLSGQRGLKDHVPEVIPVERLEVLLCGCDVVATLGMCFANFDNARAPRGLSCFDFLLGDTHGTVLAAMGERIQVP